MFDYLCRSLHSDLFLKNIIRVLVQEETGPSALPMEMFFTSAFCALLEVRWDTSSYSPVSYLLDNRKLVRTHVRKTQKE